MFDFLSNNAGLIGLVFFVTFFTGMVIWVTRPGSKKDYDNKSKIPLEDD